MLHLAFGSLDSSKAIRIRIPVLLPLTLMLKSFPKLNSIEFYCHQEQAKRNVLNLVSLLFVDKCQHELLIWSKKFFIFFLILHLQLYSSIRSLHLLLSHICALNMLVQCWRAWTWKSHRTGFSVSGLPLFSSWPWTNPKMQTLIFFISIMRIMMVPFLLNSCDYWMW